MRDRERGPLLIPLDGSRPAEESLMVAEAIADLRGTEMHVLHVARAEQGEDELAASVGLDSLWRERVTVSGTTGEASEAIVRVGKEIGADCMMMETHGRTSDMGAMAGHVTLEVLAKPPCPVYVIRSALSLRSQASRLRYLRRILVPFDGSYESLGSVREAADMALEANSRLTMLHVMNAAVRAASPMAPAFMDDFALEADAWREEFIRATLVLTGRTLQVDVDALLRAGDPGEEIARFAREWDCDLIVSTWGGDLSEGRGQVVQTLLQRAPCPLLFLLSGEAA